MAAALSGNAAVSRQHPTSLRCDGSPVCRRCGGWQCGKEEPPARRHSDTRRPNTALGVQAPPLMSCPVSPKVRPATAVGWECQKQERCWSDSARRGENEKNVVGDESTKKRWDDEVTLEVFVWFD